MDCRSIGLGRLLGGLVDADLREERRAAAGDDAAPQGGVEDGGQESGGDSHPPTAATAGVTANLTVGSSPTPKPGTLRPLKRIPIVA